MDLLSGAPVDSAIVTRPPYPWALVSGRATDERPKAKVLSQRGCDFGSRRAGVCGIHQASHSNRATKFFGSSFLIGGALHDMDAESGAQRPQLPALYLRVGDAKDHAGHSPTLGRGLPDVDVLV